MSSRRDHATEMFQQLARKYEQMFLAGDDSSYTALKVLWGLYEKREDVVAVAHALRLCCTLPLHAAAPVFLLEAGDVLDASVQARAKAEIGGQCRPLPSVDGHIDFITWMGTVARRLVMQAIRSVHRQ